MPDSLHLLTTEAALSDPAHADAIDAWWRRHGRFGQFTGQGGLALAWAAFERPDARAAVVISSGRTESQLKYVELVHDLWHQGYAVWLHDHRGQGLSERELAVSAPADRQRGHVERFDDYVADLRCFVGQHVRPAGPTPRLLLGHSMGALVGALLLEADGEKPAPERCFDAAALCAPMFSITGPGGMPLGGLVGRAAAGVAALGLGTRRLAWQGDYAAGPFEGNPYTRSEVRYRRWRQLYDRQPALRLGMPTIGWLAEACAAGERAQRDAARISVPVRVLAAGADEVVHIDGIQAFCARLRRSEDRMPGIVPEAAHELFIEHDAARRQALGEVLDFFACCALQAPPIRG